MLGGADNPNGELLSYIIGADIIRRLALSGDTSAVISIGTMDARF